MALEYSPKLVTDGLILYLNPADALSYPTSGSTFTDLTGNDNFTLYNGIGYTTDNSGILTLDGVNDYTRISSADGVVSSGTNGFSMNLWINAQTWENASCPCVGSMSIVDWSTGYWNYFGIVASGSPYWVIYNQDPYGAGSPPAGVSLGFGTSVLNTWLNFGCTFTDTNPGTMTTYLNGVQVNSGTLQSTFSITAPIEIGRYNRHCGYCYGQFKIGNFSVYNRPLSADEMLKNHNSQKSRFGL
jgi:hypothetical protein